MSIVAEFIVHRTEILWPSQNIKTLTKLKRKLRYHFPNIYCITRQNLKIEIVEDLINEQVERNAKQENSAQDGTYLSQRFSEFVPDSKVKTTQIKNETDHQVSKSNRKSKIDFKDITLFKHHSFVKIERLSQRQILDWTQKKQSSIKQPFNGFVSDKAIIKPAIIKISKSKNLKKNCKNLLSVTTVKKPQLLNILTVKNLMAVGIVIKPLPNHILLKFMKEFTLVKTQVKNTMPVDTVAKNLANQDQQKFMREFILEISHLLVKIAITKLQTHANPQWK